MNVDKIYIDDTHYINGRRFIKFLKDNSDKKKVNLYFGNFDNYINSQIKQLMLDRVYFDENIYSIIPYISINGAKLYEYEVFEDDE